MYRAIVARAGDANPPPWLTAIALADRWHVPPWVVMEQPGILQWIARTNMVDDFHRQRANLDRKMAERKAKMT